MAESSVSRQEYLLKYLSNEKKKKKKKKKTNEYIAAKPIRVQIIDDDIDIKSIQPRNVDSEPEYGDEAPLVVEVIDERPKQIITEEEYRNSTKWKLLQSPDEESSNTPNNINDDTISNDPLARNSKQKSLDSDATLSTKGGRKRHDSDTDNESEKLFQLREKNSLDSNYNHSKEKKRNYNSTESNSMRVRDPSNSDSDLSPVREQKHHETHEDSDPGIRRKRKKNSDSDLSPIREQKSDSSSDLSPVRLTRHFEEPQISKNRSNFKSDDIPLRQRKKEHHSKLLVSFEVTGLQSASSLKKEMKAVRLEEEKLFRSGEDEEIGRDAVTVFRDKLTGHKRNFKLEVMQKKEKELGEKVQAEKYRQWGKGLKQIEMNKKNLEDASNEMSKPLARYRDDVDLDKFLRMQERDGDPALLFMKKKSSTTNEQEKPKYKGPPPPPNRFGILPGFRWDGVDRSNGFEKDRFLRLSNQKALLEQSYKWSTEDM